jgi:hypothetical protein
MEAWLTFVGIWMSTGTLSKNRSSAIITSAHKNVVEKRLQDAIARLGFEVSYECENGKHTWRVHDEGVVKCFRDMCDEHEGKRFPDWVFGLSRGLVRTLLEAVMLEKGQKTWRFYTTSSTIRDQLQTLCLHAGWAANYYTRKNGMSVVTVVKTQVQPLVNKSLTKRQLDSWEPYNGKVYCCTVPRGFGVLYVRHNGKPVWCGNSRAAQKGTLGMIYNQEDMPFTKDGIVPDIILNPHAIPSRMTIGQLMECLLGKACAVTGTYGDATPFTSLTVEDIAKVLEANGHERHGNEVMYNCRTGEQIETDIFIGPTFYQRLKHMTADKIHSRSNAGPVVLLTRQPAEGRAREGGLRIGEMEQEVNIAHGLQAFLKERFLESSDNYRVFVCKKCGMMANVNPERNIYACKTCKNTSHFAEIRIPYAAKLMFQELQTMAIATRFLTK